MSTIRERIQDRTAAAQVQATLEQATLTEDHLATLREMVLAGNGVLANLNLDREPNDIYRNRADLFLKRFFRYQFALTRTPLFIPAASPSIRCLHCGTVMMPSSLTDPLAHDPLCSWVAARALLETWRTDFEN